MIEAPLDIQHIIRDFHKDSNIAVRRALKPGGAGQKGAEDSVSLKQPAPAADVEKGEETPHSNVINLELLPSGEIQINQEQRAHIINFFD